MKKYLFMALAASAFHGLPASAEEREISSYKKLIETFHLDKFYATPADQRDQITLSIKIEPENPAIKPSDMALTIVHAGSRDRLPMTAEGVIDVVPNPVWLKEDAMVVTSLPKSERSKMSVVLGTKTPDNLQIDYLTLMRSVNQWNALFKAQGGLLRLFLPKISGVEMRFAKPAQQTVRMLGKDGSKMYTADEKGVIKLKLDAALMQTNPQVVLSERPVDFGVDDD